MGRGFEKFVSGIGQGYGLGKQVGDDIQKGRSKRGVAKYGDELDAWMESDPLATTEGIPTEGGAQGPTTRDLLGIQSDYRKYAEMSGDEDAIARADRQWAEKLHNGATGALGKAGELVGKGDHAAAAKWIDRAGSFIPNGLAYKTTIGEDGKLMVSSYDENTGQMTEQRPATQQDIVQMSATLGDANKATAFMSQAMAQGASRRQQEVENAVEQEKVAQGQQKADASTRTAQTGAINAVTRGGELAVKQGAQELKEKQAPVKTALDLSNIERNLSIADGVTNRVTDSNGNPIQQDRHERTVAREITDGVAETGKVVQMGGGTPEQRLAYGENGEHAPVIQSISDKIISEGPEMSAQEVKDVSTALMAQANDKSNPEAAAAASEAIDELLRGQ